MAAGSDPQVGVARGSDTRGYTEKQHVGRVNRISYQQSSKLEKLILQVLFILRVRMCK